jgi:hypothetical protein
MNESMDETMRGLANTAIRIKDERDEAVRLLKEALLYSHIGANGPFKSTVRKFLAKLGVIKDYADTMIDRDRIERHTGRPEHDADTFGRPMKAGS